MIRAFIKVLSVILISTTFLSSQLNVSFTGGNVAPSGTVDVDVSVSGFDNVTSFQFSVNWNPSVLNYGSIENLTTDLEQFNEGNNIGTPPTAEAVSEGQLTVSWNLQSTEPRTIADNTRLFTIRLSAVGNACDETMFTLSDNPRQIEVADQNFMLIAATSTNSTVSIDGTDCEGGNNGGGNAFSDCDTSCDGTSDTSLSIECVNVDLGATNVCLEVTATNYSNMSALQTAIAWDPAVLTYTSLNQIILQNATVNAVNDTNGLARYIWLQGFGEDPVTVADGTVLFEICFDVIGAEGTESFVEFVEDPPFIIELSTDLAEAVPFCIQNGLITVGEPDDGGNNGGGGGGEPLECDNTCDSTTDVALIVGCVEIDENASTACVPISTINFTNIAAVQIGMSWDRTVLTYTNINEEALTNIPPPNEANTGELRIIWLEPTGFNPLTVADDATLFEVCFDFIGDPGDMTEVNILPLTNPNFIIEITNGDGMASDPCVQKGFVFQEDGEIDPGGIDCEGDDGEDVCISSSDVALIIPDVNIDPGSSACIPVTVRNFANIAGMQFVIDWDPTVLSFDELREVGMDMFSTVVNDVTGQIRLVWLIGLNDDPITLADGTTIFELCFTASGQQGDCTNVSIIDGNGLNIEILDAEASNLPRCIDNGNVTLGDDTGGLTISAENASGNTGSEVCVDITATDWTDIQSAQFNITWDDAVLEFSRVIDTEVLNDFGTSNVNLDASDNVRVSWSPINPQTLTGTPVIFEICYNLIGDCTSPSSSINFVSTNNISIEFTNSSTEVLQFSTQPGEIIKLDCVDGALGVNVNSISSPNCMDENTGSITVNVFGGTTPYTCTWVNAAGNVVASSNTDCNLTNVVVGTYTLTVMDADGASLSQSFTIEPFEILVTPNITDQSCNGAGSISLAVSGGAVPYTYNWNPNVGTTGDIMNIVAGDYSVTITDANGCTTARTYTVNGGGDAGNPLSLELNRIENITCDEAGGIRIDVSGGCPNYSFQWRGPNGEFVSAKDLFRIAPGVWQVTVTDDSGTELTNAFTLATEIDPIEINSETIGATCNGGSNGSINVTPTGGCNSYAFNWDGPNDFASSSEDVSGLVPGDYMVTVEDTDNPGILSTRTINVPEVGDVEISAEVSDVTNVDGNNGSINISTTGGTGNLTYEWSDGPSDEDRVDLVPGTYTVSITDDSSCTSTATFQVRWGAIFADDIILAQGISCFGLSDAIIGGRALGGCGGTVVRINAVAVSLPAMDLGIGEYEVSVADTCGNEVIKTITIEDYQSFVITATDSCIVNMSESTGMATLDIQGGSGKYTVSWNSGTISTDSLTASDLPEGDVIAIVDDGCDMQEITISIINCVDIPPVPGPGCSGRPIITPNNDGLNDAFVMGCDGGGLTEPNNLTIYDRWGNLMFEANNYDNSWMGTDMSGQELNEAGYMWVLISGTGSDRVIDKGTVTVLKTN